MAVVRVLDHGQVTIPKAVREALDLKKGDLAEVELEGDRVVITPQRLVQKQTLQKLMALLDRVHEQNRDVSEEQVEQDVLHAIAELRADEYAHAPTKKTARRAR
jgi:AbrB family looped-hinge helix DNA binding protein